MNYLKDSIGNTPLYWRPEYYGQFADTFIPVRTFRALSWWVRDNSTLKSGFHSPFGGVYKTSDGNYAFNFQRHLESVINVAKSLRLNEIEVRLQPQMPFMDPNLQTLQVLLDSNFEVKYEESDQYVLLQKDWLGLLNRNRLRELKKSQDDYICFSGTGFEQFSRALEIIQGNRSFKNRATTLSINKLMYWLDELNNHVTCYLVWSKKVSSYVAAALCQRITREIEYVYMWGDNRTVTSNNHLPSPITKLASSIFEICQDRGTQVVYLGSSSHLSILDEGLFKFKKSLGAEACPKYILGLTIS
jgi:hypothetical protein